jgi:hypothetical protein
LVCSTTPPVPGAFAVFFDVFVAGPVPATDGDAADLAATDLDFVDLVRCDMARILSQWTRRVKISFQSQ